ncbi:MAG: ArnT family glycosyltransferase [Thermoproteota archaeon]
MTVVQSGFSRYFEGWRLILLIFLLFYATLLILDLGYEPIHWDEAPHLQDGLTLSRDRLKEYLQEGSRYPPLFDVVTALYFKVLGAGVFSARLVSVTFGVLSVWAVFEFTNYLYGPRTGMVSSVLLVSMPGFIWLCRLALLETMLIFFFILSLLFFFSGLHKDSGKMWLSSGVSLGLGALVKYQAVVGGLVMLVTGVILWRKHIREKIGVFLLMFIIAGSMVLSWVFFRFERAQDWLYVLQVGSTRTLEYSERFFSPIFYLIEMTNPYPHVHPISIPIFLLALLGLGLWLWLRREQDEFCLIWFFTVYSFFTLLPAKSWRYITMAFPVLAVSAAVLTCYIWNKIKNHLKPPQTSKNLTKVVAVFFILLVSIPIIYSSQDAYSWIQKGHFHIPVEKATQYAASRTDEYDTILVLCPSNLFYADSVQFYLKKQNANYNKVYQYPQMPVDAYPPSFNITELIQTCEDAHVKYLLLYQYGNIPFYKSELTSLRVIQKMNNTHRFFPEAEYGSPPRKVFIFSFPS